VCLGLDLSTIYNELVSRHQIDKEYSHVSTSSLLFNGQEFILNIFLGSFDIDNLPLNYCLLSCQVIKVKTFNFNVP